MKQAVEEAAQRADEECARKEAELAAAREQELAERAAEARFEAVQKFLADNKFKGINIGRKSLTKTTYPIHEAAKRNDIEMVKMLVEEGANVEQMNSRKQTALQRATQEDKKGSHKEIIRLLNTLSTECKSRA